jgi:hypothetical protein
LAEIGLIEGIPVCNKIMFIIIEKNKPVVKICQGGKGEFELKIEVNLLQLEQTVTRSGGSISGLIFPDNPDDYSLDIKLVGVNGGIIGISRFQAIATAVAIVFFQGGFAVF